MKNSKIEDHQLLNKELVPPFLKGKMGELMTFHSWSKERLPEYVWIGLLRDSCKSRHDFFSKFHYLKEYILGNYEDDIGRVSKILELSQEDKIKLFEIIKEIFGDYVLDPLILVSHFDKELREAFYDKSNTNDNRIDKIESIVKEMYDRYSEVAMDVRYIVIILGLNKIRFIRGTADITREAIQKYPTIDFKTAEKEGYTCMLSSLEGMSFSIENKHDYSEYFYKEMYLMSDCKLLVINHSEISFKEQLEERLKSIKKLLVQSNEIKYDHKKDVIVGHLSYVYKLITEIHSNDLGRSITSRLAMRTLVEIYANLKFICMNSEAESQIWESFKDYGNGKYKIIYKRIEDGIADKSECTHFNEKLTELLATEDKSAEFLKVKFSNFAGKNARQKFKDIKEKNLYDTYYDYDSCFIHAYWSAIRESALLVCNNPLHNYHQVPDFDNQQQLLCIYKDFVYILDKIIPLVTTEIGVE